MKTANKMTPEKEDFELHKIYANELSGEVVFIHARSKMLVSKKDIFIFTYLSKHKDEGDENDGYFSLTAEQFFERFTKKLPYFNI